MNRGAQGAAVRLAAGVGCGSLRAMEGEPLGEDALLWQLRDSRRRFQTRMQRLIEKVGPPPPNRPAGVGEAGRDGEGGKRGWGLG